MNQMKPMEQWTNERIDLCETCQGEGEGMMMVCYGGPPIETIGPCPDCDGTGNAPYECFREYMLLLLCSQSNS
jgi:DnaJ-class molecular chaperone